MTTLLLSIVILATGTSPPVPKVEENLAAQIKELRATVRSQAIEIQSLRRELAGTKADLAWAKQRIRELEPPKKPSEATTRPVKAAAETASIDWIKRLLSDVDEAYAITTAVEREEAIKQVIRKAQREVVKHKMNLDFYVTAASMPRHKRPSFISVRPSDDYLQSSRDSKWLAITWLSSIPVHLSGSVARTIKPGDKLTIHGRARLYDQFLHKQQQPATGAPRLLRFSPSFGPSGRFTLALTGRATCTVAGMTVKVVKSPR